MELNNIARKWFTFWISNRVLRNLIFWFLIGYATVFNIDMLTDETLTVKQVILTFFMHFLTFGPLIYFNNLFVLPRFFFRGEYFQYFLITIIAVLFYPIYTGTIIEFYSSITPQDLPRIQLADLNYFIGVIANVLWVATFSMIKLGSDHLLEKSKIEKIEKEKAKSELDSLKNQMDPHFLFNGLNTIYGLSITEDARTSDSILKLSDIMRYVLYECNEEKVSLDKEIAYINNYIEFGKLRRKKVEQIEFDVNGEYIGKRIAPLILIPFIENAFKHGVDGQIIDPWIKVELNIEDDQLTFTCSNSARNKQKDQIRKDKGIGLQNVMRRLELLYPNQYELDIQQDETAYYIKLNMRL